MKRRGTSPETDAPSAAPRRAEGRSRAPRLHGRGNLVRLPTPTPASPAERGPPLWARGTDPIPQETEPVNDTQTTLGLLAELETVLAEAEELR